MSSDRIRTMTAEGVEVLGFMPDVALAMESNRVVCQVLLQQISVLEKRLEAQVKLQPILCSPRNLGEYLGLLPHRPSATFHLTF